MIKKDLRAAVAGGAVAALLVAGTVTGGYLALWSDSSNGAGGTVTAGNLDVGATAVKWFDASPEALAANGGQPKDITATIADYRAVPGDVLYMEAGQAVALEGDHLKAKLVIASTAGTGDLAAKLQMKWEIFAADAAGVPTGAALASGTTAGSTVEAVDLVPGAGVPKALTGAEAAKYVVRVSATFDKDTANRDAAQTTATLAGLSATLTQVRP